MLSRNKIQSLYDQLRGIGGWRVPTPERAAEIKEELYSHYEEEASEALDKKLDELKAI